MFYNKCFFLFPDILHVFGCYNTKNFILNLSEMLSSAKMPLRTSVTVASFLVKQFITVNK
ncbi:hypothetical protein EXN66_Car012126 [Channa argus]|uniref:Uncharacterized protein n=1 Tax=Channa argus TaxID=215402 RepID=A0A6G1Q2F9_CHAAH|nr:hypothetical protein EXN66_Car012126 [Channa argus]